jgi:glucose-6-phosphate isomerase
MSKQIFSINFEKALDAKIEKSLIELESKGIEALERLNKRCLSGELGFRDHKYTEEELKEIEETASWIRSNAKDFVVLGIGGSSLGGKTILSSLSDRFSKKETRVHFIDNVDPDLFNELLSSLDLSSTVFNVISKSGSTAETMSQFLIVYKELSNKLGKEEAVKRIILTTDPKKGALRPLVSSMGFKAFKVPENIGGRFSALSDVGILPSAVAGINIRELLQGAEFWAKDSKTRSLKDNITLKYSLIKYLHYKMGKNCSVIMPYSTKLSDLSFWYVQLWAESLGKKGFGQTPIPATGATDQHSQLQLFMEGPKDKFITFIGVEKPKKDLSIPKFDTDVEAFSYLSGHTMNELIRAEMLSTEQALFENAVPSIRIELPVIDAYKLGALFMFFQISVAITGELMDINAFDQPGVELSKKYTYKMMGRRGY